jgi:hypothetical protein
VSDAGWVVGAEEHGRDLTSQPLAQRKDGGGMDRSWPDSLPSPYCSVPRPPCQFGERQWQAPYPASAAQRS